MKNLIAFLKIIYNVETGNLRFINLNGIVYF